MHKQERFIGQLGVENSALTQKESNAPTTSAESTSPSPPMTTDMRMDENQHENTGHWTIFQNVPKLADIMLYFNVAQKLLQLYLYPSFNNSTFEGLDFHLLWNLMFELKSRPSSGKCLRFEKVDNESIVN